MLSNKNANILAFDEVIGKETSFEGNCNSMSIKETKSIIEYLIEQDCITKNITNNFNTMYGLLGILIAIILIGIIYKKY